MSETSILQNIAAAALIGTQRQAFTAIATDGNLGKVLADVDRTNQESALLSTIAIVTLHQQAGQIPISDRDPLPVACDLDDLPCCRDRTAHHLSLMLGGEHTEILPELLDCLATVGQRVNETSLPALLDLGKQKSDLRSAIAKVLGKRGQWLAAQNPEWNYLASEDASVWETGSKAARLMWLSHLRRHDPDQARQKLEAVWKQENASDRTAFLEVLETNLSMADEPFLESLLDDRSKEVRRVTVDLLTWLPESRFCQRAIARVQDLVKFHREGNQSYFTVDLPETHTPEMVRDGIEAKSKYADVGDRAFSLLQILTATPLNFWTQQFSMSVSDLIQVAKHTKSDTLVMRGFALAAKVRGDLVWIKALLSYNKKQSEVISIISSLSPQAINRALLAPEQQEARLQMIKNPDLAFSDIHSTLLFSDRSPELSQAVLEFINLKIEDCIYNSQNSGRNYWTLCEFIRKASTYIVPSLIAIAIGEMGKITQKLENQSEHENDESQEKLKVWGYIKTSMLNSIRQFVEALQLRQEMLESITSDGVSL
jgi:hypothetical protein